VKAVLRTIDSISEWVGKTASWLSVPLILVITYEVVMRYVFVRPSLWPFEVSVMLGASMYILAFSYVHRHGAHVRADTIYLKLSPRGRAAIDVFGGLFVFFPLIFLLVDISWNWMWRAWVTGELMALTGWYPPAAPLRTVVMMGFAFFALQGIAVFVRDLHLLIKGKPYD